MDTRQRPSSADPGDVWDRLLASAHQPGSTMPSGSGLATLRLSPTAERRHLTGQRRTFAEIDPDLRAVIRELVRAARPWPLALHGPAGTGKTCAALCLLDHAGGEYWTAGGLCEQMIAAQWGRLSWANEGRSGALWPEMVWRQIARAPLVVLDELGCREKVSDFAYEVTKRCIDERQGKPLVTISNFALDELGRLYDDRIASRLAAGMVVHLAGADRRLRPSAAPGRQAALGLDGPDRAGPLSRNRLNGVAAH